MKTYRSHKTVQAFKISRVETLQSEELIGGDGPRPDGAMLYDESGSMQASVAQAYLTKHRPKVGGYYVQYEDGYESWSPAEAFEGGYTEMTE